MTASVYCSSGPSTGFLSVACRSGIAGVWVASAHRARRAGDGPVTLDLGAASAAPSSRRSKSCSSIGAAGSVFDRGARVGQESLQRLGQADPRTTTEDRDAPDRAVRDAISYE